jgi:hypothetical protein
VTPVLRVELPGIVEAVAEFRRVALELVPFLAGDLTGLAPDADARVREEPLGAFFEVSNLIRIRLVVIFVTPRSAGAMSWGIAAISSTTASACP